nr:PREDICTED: synaptopodin 2-like protein [Lepisosteus oculatus]
MVVEEAVITLSGGAPWGFRLQGGADHRKPLLVAKVRKRSKACRAGLCEGDELLSINEKPCGGLSHAQAMNLIDSCPGVLHIRVKRAPTGFQSVVLVPRAPSPRIDKEYRAALRALSPPQPTGPEVTRARLMSPTLRGPEALPEECAHRDCLTSPPDSEAYYGETDSDADTAHEKQRRQKRRSPSSSPGKASGKASPAETSEMSGYDSAPDTQACPQPPTPGPGHSPPAKPQVTSAAPQPAVARKEVAYQPRRVETSFCVWQPPGETPPHAGNSAENSSASTDDQSPRDGQGAVEVDSGFQEPPNPLPPLVSPERARGVSLLLSGSRQLVPMVGPVDNPVDEELTVTYMDKAKQAKLHRSESVQEKQVKEARTKCRTIASLLTDAPNPHSKGVLMFKKRRQRAKKYTLISYGSVEEDQLRADMEGDEDEEDGVLPTSESEFDEDGFAAAADADTTWDSDYLDILEKKDPASQRSSSPGAPESPGLPGSAGRGAQLFEQQRKRAEEHTVTGSVPEVAQMPREAGTPNTQPSTPITPPSYSVMNGDISPKSRSAELMSPPHLAPMPVRQPVVVTSPQLPDLPSSSVLNRTARPFTPGFVSSRAATAPVIFRPTSARKTPSQPPSSQPMASVPAPFSAPPASAPKLAISTASLYIPARSASAVAPLSVLSPPPPFSPPPAPAAPLPSSLQPPAAAPPVAGPIAPPAYSAPSSTEALVSREQRISVPAARTGILQEARRRSTKKPMFSRPEEKKGSSPNPELLSLVQNLDERPKGVTEAGFESGPEEDFLNLGAEACNFMQAQKHKVPPPVAPKPRIHVPEIPQLGGKGAELFARRQSRMDRFVVDTSPQQTSQPASPARPRLPSPTPSLPSHWKYSSNIRAPPPIGYNPLLSPSCPPGAQRSTKAAEAPKTGTWSGRKTSQKEGIKAIDFIRRQPYQLNPAMFSFGSSGSSVAQQSRPLMGSSLTQPRQIPVKAARVYEIKRFSTPTPMSVPTSLTPTVIAPRAATTLGEPLFRSNICSPPPTTTAPPPASAPAPAGTPVQEAKQYQTTPELSPLGPSRPSVLSSAATIQVPKPRFQASKIGIQSNVWRPGALRY